MTKHPTSCERSRTPAASIRRSCSSITFPGVRWLLGLLMVGLCVTLAQGDERTLTPEQMEKLASEGELFGAGESVRSEKLPDLTKGQLVGEKIKPNSWHLGPTGIIGYLVGGLKGDQIQVETMLKGSPADGQLRWGDVIIGINGKKFSSGKNMGIQFGNEIIAAELPENEGQLKLLVWRDENFAKRNGAQDVVNVDIEELFGKAAADQSLYDWKPESARDKELINDNYEKFPLLGKYLEITLTLKTLPPYSNTSPYDCPKADQILVNAWKVLEAEFASGRIRGGRGGTVAALALVASGKPEHRKIVHDWVRGEKSPWRPPTQPIGEMFKPDYKGYKGYQSWHHGFNGLDCAIYYDATGDDYVLPALRKYAIETAMGQAGGGSWGHTFAYPSFNGGELHQMNPGYGALNAAGNRCFFLVALAKKLGINHPEIELAAQRGQHFFGSFIDKGGIPYGMHGAAATDDSNGKNTGVAFALKCLGDDHGAKFFAQMSTHASFTRRGGHGNDYFWHYSPWAATLCGPQGTIVTHRNLRWRFTLCRRFDGAFVIQSPTGGLQSLRNPTATFALHYSAPYKQTLWTGKDVDPSYAWDTKSMDQLITSALPQLNDPKLIKLSGTPWRERSTDEIFALLDMFKPKARGQYAKELGDRYQAGERDILPRLASLLESEEPRLRDSGCRGLAACGPEATLQYMSKVARLLDDPHEYVRMQAIRVMTAASDGRDTQLALLRATVKPRENETASPNNFPAWVQQPLFGAQGSQLAESPFDAGFDEELVQAALEKVLDLDPIGNRGMLRSRSKVWTKNTIVRLAGPLMYVAENEQTSDQMFAGRNVVGQALLSKYGYREAIEAGANYLRKKTDLPRHIRPFVTYKRALVNVDLIKANPGACRELLPSLNLWLADDPLAAIKEKKGETVVVTRVQDLISMIEDAKQAEQLPSLAADAERYFATTLEEASGFREKQELCRDALSNLNRKNYFQKIAALDYLVETLGPDAIDDLVPYLAHDYWRLREHSRALALRLNSSTVTDRLLARFQESDGPLAAAVLSLLADRGNKEALPIARKALHHSEAAVRTAAPEAIIKLGGEQEANRLFAHLREARSTPERQAVEDALLRVRNHKSVAQSLQKQAIEVMHQWPRPSQNSLIWLLAQLGGEESFAAIHKMSEGADDPMFRQIVYALSWSPDERASKTLLKLIEEYQDTPRANIAAKDAVRRMVVGPRGLGKLTNREKLDFADPLLQLVRHDSMVAYLGTIHSGRSAQILQRAMRKGGVTATAAASIISATTGMEKAPAADRKRAATALVDAIEFIEVNYLRGGVAEVINKNKQERGAYTRWKSLSAQAGKNLLKLDNPRDAPLPEFNDLDLDF